MSEISSTKPQSTAKPTSALMTADYVLLTSLNADFTSVVKFIYRQLYAF